MKLISQRATATYSASDSPASHEEDYLDAGLDRNGLLGLQSQLNRK